MAGIGERPETAVYCGVREGLRKSISVTQSVPPYGYDESLIAGLRYDKRIVCDGWRGCASVHLQLFEKSGKVSGEVRVTRGAVNDSLKLILHRTRDPAPDRR